MSKFRLILSSTLALAISIFSAGFAAQAAGTPTLTIANNGTSLTGSAINNFDPTATLRLDLSASSGVLTVTLGTSGALVAPGAVLKGSSVAITGTQAELNAALATTEVSQNCSTTRTVTGNVSVGTDVLVLNPANGHWYSNVGTLGITWDDAKTAAAAKTIPNTTGHGYLATITSEAENTFLNNNFTNTPMIGASDATTEGDWYWMDGPEAGTKFYSGGAAVADSYVKWDSGEPNDMGGNEDYAQLWSGDTWNDISGDSSYVVEFGGMAGDDFSTIQVATASETLTVPVLLTGAGTLASPLLVSNANEFAGVATCSVAGVHFKQTADIVMGSDFAGGGTFAGHYDGNGKTLDFSATVLTSSPIFGDVTGTASATDASISHLNITGAISESTQACGASVLAGQVRFATIDDVHLTGAKVTTRCGAGLLADRIVSSVVKNTSVVGEVLPTRYLFGLGGLATTASSSQFLNVDCNLTIAAAESPWNSLRAVESMGGCIGRSDNSTYSDVHATGATTLVSELGGPPMVMRSIGGLIGESYLDAMADSSSSISLTTKRGQAIGGLIGSSNQSTVTRSFATGAITDTQGSEIGGLIGYAAASTISNVYATGAVSGDYMIGSLVGDMQAGSTVSKAYATGLVTVNDATMSRGLIGYTDGTNVVDSYWKILAGGVPSTIESFGQEVPKFAGELKRISTFANWNISATPSSANDWAICPGANGGYPYLAWQTVANGCSRSFTAGGTATLSGLAYVGSSMNATVSGWDSLADLTYQWFEGSTAITGATTAYFKPTSAHKGKLVSVTVTGSKEGYVSAVATSTAVKVAGAPLSATVVVGGFAAKSSKATAATKASIAKAIKGIGTVISVKCEGYATAKKLTAAQKALATARANTVCAAVKATFKSSTTKSLTSLFKKTDKLAEGVRVTFTAVK